MCMIGSFIVCFMVLIATFRPAHWWSSSGDGVDLQRGIISTTLLMLTGNVFVIGSVIVPSVIRCGTVRPL